MRDILSDKIKRTILGPIFGLDESLLFRPLNLYTTGILYPQSIYSDHKDTSLSSDTTEDVQKSYKSDDSDDVPTQKESEERKTKKDAEDDDIRNEEDDELKLATNFFPSSLGFSFLVDSNESFKVKYSFGGYNRKKIKDNTAKGDFDKYNWVRTHYEDLLDCSIDDNTLLVNKNIVRELFVIDEDNFRVKLNFFIRNLDEDKEQKLITISLINCLLDQKKDNNCIFQPTLTVESDRNIFHSFPDKTNYKNIKDDIDELNNALLYRDYKVFAMGHGVSVDWDNSDRSENVKSIQTVIMPEEKVYGVDVDRNDILSDTDVLEMKQLSGFALNDNSFDEPELFSKLNDFIILYHNWIEEQAGELEKLRLSEELNSCGNNNINQCRRLYERLKRGVEIIQSNDDAKRAFFDANCAMFIQRVLGQFSTWRRDNKNVVPGTDGYLDMKVPEFRNLPSGGQDGSDAEFGFYAKWRPFQLAFILSQIEGIVDPNSIDRDTMDLIWFPTGGGKTEAYLGLIAFTLFYRRLKEKNPDDGAGVTVMMRYTLRMLNLDQFQRANVLISACEIIRRNNERVYGKVRYTSGIWVGQSLTPNRYEDTSRAAKDGYNSNIKTYIENIERNRKDRVNFSPFITYCPCCGNFLLKERNNSTIEGEWGYFRRYRTRDGLNNPKGNYLVSCTNKECHFYTVKNTRSDSYDEDRTFPFYTVDEEIFIQRPSLLFGTVDKYAQIAWKKDCSNLFNLDSDNNNSSIYPSPELIIQDELHLIGSSLGTIYGLFEYAIDKLCSQQNIMPKIVGATATVRNASTQCKRLYNRSNFAQFPPPAISADDSFYMKKDLNDKKPRKYLGFMPSGFTSTTSIIRLASALIEIPNSLPKYNIDLDKYYTLLVYFNSLKELGKFRTFIDDDIFAYRKFLDSSVLNKIHQNLSGRDIELSSAMSADDITLALEQLKKNKLKDEIKKDFVLDNIEKTGIRSFRDWQETTNKKAILSKDLFESIGIEHSGEYQTDKKGFETVLHDYFEMEKNNPVKIATATNMIATGVDISRLNLMMINGHPKSSSEYIQASSRVGREDAGLIFSFYSATKNRDRSHYENYKAFHQAFYKYVEPASVTPHSMPAMEKIIPSIIISLVWILYRRSNPSSFSYNNDIERFIDRIKNEITERFGQNVEQCIELIMSDIKDKWSKFNPKDRRFASFHDYLKNPLQTITLNEVFDVPSNLADLKTAQHLIPKVSTMRDVEPNCDVKLCFYE